MTKEPQRWIIHNIDTLIKVPSYGGKKIWTLAKNEFWIEMKFDIGHRGGEFKYGITDEINIFELDVIKVEFLKAFIDKNGMASPKYVVIVENFHESEIVDYVNMLLKQCSDKDWKSTSEFLSLFMGHEYNGYIAPIFELE